MAADVEHIFERITWCVNIVKKKQKNILIVILWHGLPFILHTKRLNLQLIGICIQTFIISKQTHIKLCDGDCGLLGYLKSHNTQEWHQKTNEFDLDTN